MGYTLGFDFKDGTVVNNVAADQIISDSQNKMLRINIIAEAQRVVREDQLLELVRRIQTETPRSIVISGDHSGVFLAREAARSGGDVLLNFSFNLAEEEAFIDGATLVF